MLAALHRILCSHILKHIKLDINKLPSAAAFWALQNEAAFLLGCCWFDIGHVLTFLVRQVGRAQEDRTCNKKKIFSSSSFF